MTTGGLGDLAWLAGVELRNRTLAMAGRLRNPRYLIAFLFGVGYFVLLFSPQLAAGGAEGMQAPAWAVIVAPLGVAALVLFWWLRGGYQDALAFRPEEVHFLFTAPLTRPTLIRYKLLRAQAGVLVSALLVGILRPGAAPWYLTLPAAWVVVATLHLHQVGASLVRVTAGRGGRGGLRRVAVPLALLAAVAGTLVWTAARAIRAAREADSLDAAFAAALAALSSPVAEAALLPFSLLLSPLFARDASEWALGMVAAAGLLVLHVLWVHRTDAAFEEAAAEAGRKRARIVAAARAGKAWWRVGKDEHAVRRWLRPPLRPAGEPALALTWSHVMAFAGDVRPTTLWILLGSAAAVLAIMSWAAGSVADAAAGAAGMAVALAGTVFVFGPLVVRYDLRRDLSRLDLLRSYPLEPRWLVIGELAAPVILLTVIELALLAGACLLAIVAGTSPDLLEVALPFALALAVNAPGLLALQVAVQNGLALLFPGWVRIGPGGSGGIDAVGQGILSTLAAVLLFLLLVLPPALAAALVGAAYGPALAGWAAVPAAMAFTAAVWIEVAWLVARLARAYERLDPVEAGLLH